MKKLSVLGLLVSAFSASASPWVDGGANGITTTGKVGVGTTAVNAALHVKGVNYNILTLETSNSDSYVTLTAKPTGAGRFAFNSWGGASGFIFGTGDPSANGYGTELMRLQNFNTAGGLVLRNSGTTPEYALRGNSDTWLFGYVGASGSEDISIGSQANSGTRTLTFAAGGLARMKIAANGRVGIGNLNPTEMLEVAGNIKANTIKVAKFEVVPDYVFDKDYDLEPLKNVERFVKANKHLKDVPSAKELNSKGMDLASMNLALLRKVEELTLHAIQQEKRISALEKERRVK